MLVDGKKQKLDYLLERSGQLMMERLQLAKVRLDHLKHNYLLLHPQALYRNQQVKLQNLIEKLTLVNPLDTLKRGYSLSYKDGNLIKSVSQVTAGDQITIQVSDGVITSSVIEKES